jgi:nicotinate phosphoribosyltransferase
MGQVVFHHFPTAEAEYEFVCRTKGIDLTPYVDEIGEEIQHYCNLKLNAKELMYLHGQPFLKTDYVEFLKDFQPKLYHVIIKAENGELKIIIRGPWYQTIFFEVPVLSIVNEVYFRNICKEPDYEGAWKLLEKKCELINEADKNGLNFRLMEFGTRRRFSNEWQGKIIKGLSDMLPKEILLGTSNIYYALEYGLKPLGTMAHEFISGCQGLFNLRESQKKALDTWMLEYRGQLGAALTDTLTTDVFVKDFDLLHAKAYDAVRQDSGSIDEWVPKILNMYNRLGINPRTKTAIFSDGLDIPTALKVCYKYSNDINCVFGVGTNLTNDMPHVTPLNIVMKLVRVNGQPVAKLSDVPTKAICKSETYLKLIKETFGIRD